MKTVSTVHLGVLVLGWLVGFVLFSRLEMDK